MAQQHSQQALVKRIQEVLAHHKQGHVNEAIIGYEEILPQMVAGPVKVSLLGNVGALQMNVGNYEQAKTHFMNAIEIAPDNGQVHFNLAVLLTSKLNQHAKAIRHCALAMKYDQKNHKTYHLMGNIMQSLGKMDDAERYYTMAEEIAQEHLQAAEQSSSSSASAESGTKKAALQVFYERLFASLESQQTIDIHRRTCTVKIVSKHPLIIVVENFLSDEECDHIRDKVAGKLEKSFVMGSTVKVTDAAAGEGGESSTVNTAGNVERSQYEEDPSLFRSSYTAWLPQDDVLHQLQDRLATILALPIGYLKQKSEDLQVVKYHIGGQFKAHQDSSAFHTRLLTALMYLNDVPAVDQREVLIGGETWFPFAEQITTEGEENSKTIDKVATVEAAVLQALNLFEEYDETVGQILPGVKVSAKKGQVAIFFNYDQDGHIDPLAVHAGLPIRKINKEYEITEDIFNQVQKWVANYWLDYDLQSLEKHLLA